MNYRLKFRLLIKALISIMQVTSQNKMVFSKFTLILSLAMFISLCLNLSVAAGSSSIQRQLISNNIISTITVSEPIAKVYGQTVGILRIIYPQEDVNFVALSQVQENQIVAVSYYPTADPALARPAGIITTDEPAGLSHAQIRARFWGIPHIVINDLRHLEEYAGKWIYMASADKGVILRFATQDEIDNWKSYKPRLPEAVVADVDLSTAINILDWPATTDFRQVSHKFQSLHAAEKALEGMPVSVSKGSVIPYSTYQRVLDANPGIEARIHDIIQRIDNDNIYDIAFKLSQVQRIIECLDITEDIWSRPVHDAQSGTANRSIKDAIEQESEDGSTLFIRSGTNAEDLPDYAGLGAGLYSSFSNVKKEDAVLYIKKAWASVWNLGAYLERQKLKIDHFAVHAAVQITKCINAEYAFVVHTADPDEQNAGVLVIGIVQGLGEGLVGDDCQGKAHRFVYDKKTREVSGFVPATKVYKIICDEHGSTKIIPADYAGDIFIRDRENSQLVRDIALAAIRIEAGFNRPQDIEGVIVSGSDGQRRSIIITQSRSQVGYASYRYSEEDETFYKVNSYWAQVLIDKFAHEPEGLPSAEIFEKIYFTFVQPHLEGHADADSLWLARMYKLFDTQGEPGLAFAAKIILSCRGTHNLQKNAFNELDVNLKSKLLEKAAIDFSSLDDKKLGSFINTSNFASARLIVSQASAAEVSRMFYRMQPRRLAYLIGEVSYFYNMRKEKNQEDDIHIQPEEMARIAAGIVMKFNSTDEDIFLSSLTDQSKKWLGLDSDTMHGQLVRLATLQQGLSQDAAVISAL